MPVDVNTASGLSDEHKQELAAAGDNSITERELRFEDKKKKFHKAFLAGLSAVLAAGGILLVCLCISLFVYRKQTAAAVEDNVGKAPAALTEELKASDAMAYGADTGSGWICQTFDETPSLIKYGYDGQMLWRQEYTYELENPYIDAVAPTADGGFVFVLTQGSSSEVDYTRFSSIIRCDPDGREVWRISYKDKGHIRFDSVFELQDGGFLAIGTWDKRYYNLEDIYLCTLSNDGDLLKEATYGGTDFDSVRQAVIVEGCGVAVDVFTQSKDGEFSASEDGYPVTVLAMFDFDLTLKWHHVLEWYIYFDNGMIAKDKEVYLSQYRYEGSGEERIREVRLAKYAATGEEIWVKERKTRLYDEFDQDVYFLPNNENQVIIYDDESLFYINANGWITRVLPNILERPERVVSLQGETVVLSLRDIFAEEAVIDPNKYYIERIYSGYTKHGHLLWRRTLDITAVYR